MADNIAPESSQTQSTPEQIVAPVSQTPDRYSRYRELNKAPESAGSESGTPVGQTNTTGGVKQETTATPAAAKKTESAPKEHESGYDRRIRVLTAREKAANERNAALEARLNALEGKLTPQQPKLTRDNFLTDSEYDAYREKELLGKVTGELQTRESQRQQEEAKQREFKSSWADRVNTIYTDPVRKQAFADLVRESPDNLHSDVHDYVKTSNVGPMMLEAFLMRPDFAEQVSQMPAIKRAATLMRLEDGINEHLATRATTPPAPSRPAASQVSRAPAPVGPVGVSSAGTVDPNSLPSEDRVRAYKQKRFGR